jgi:hypothetical protein
MTNATDSCETVLQLVRPLNWRVAHGLGIWPVISTGNADEKSLRQRGKYMESRERIPLY